MGLVTLDRLRCGEVMFVVCKFYTFNQPILESLLGDGFAFDSSAISDKELGSAILPEVTGASHIRIEFPCGHKSLRSAPSVWLRIAGTKMGQAALALV